MPTEIRRRIWDIYYNEISRPRIRYASFGGSGMSQESEMDIKLLFAWKEIYAEVQPIVVFNIQLNIVSTGTFPVSLC